MKLGLIAFTQAGEKILDKISLDKTKDCNRYNKSTDELRSWLRKSFSECDGIIFVGAVGIAVRLISPLIKSKDIDPAVIVIDEKGQYILPILSGHIGGGNKLANELATTLLATPIITTATDLNQKLAIDTWAVESGAVVANIDMIKHISAAILKGDEVFIESDFSIEGTLPNELTHKSFGKLGVMVSLDETKKPFDKTLNIIPKIITLGIGCRKDISPASLKAFIEETLANEKISIKAVDKIASIDIKSKEKAILEFADEHGIKACFYTADELSELEGSFTKSEFVKATTGVDNVCERSAMLCSGGELILQKTAKDGMTIAIAKSTWRCRF